MATLAAAVDLVTAILLVLVAVLGLILNLIVLLTVLQHKGLRNSFTAIICFMCVLHIVEYIIPLPLKVIGDLLHFDVPQWSLGCAVCKFFNFTFHGLTFSVAYCILLLVLDRYFYVRKRSFWTIKTALVSCSALTFIFIVLNAGNLAIYGINVESIGKGKVLPTCGITTLPVVSLITFFVFGYLLPVVGTFGGTIFLARLLRIRKEFQLGDDVDVSFMANMTIIIFAFGSYAVLRLVWHVDRLLLVGGLVFDNGDLVIQDVAEVLWYLHGVLLAAFVIIVYPHFKDGVRSLCFGSSSQVAADTVSCASDDDDLVLMPVVTTEADPERHDTWPQIRHHVSGLSLASTTISSEPERPNSPTWRIVRTLDRPQPKSKDHHVQRVPVHRRPKSATLEKEPKGYSSARSRSSSPSSEHKEETLKSRRPRLFRKKKKAASSGDEAN